MARELKDAPLSTLVAVKGIRSTENLVEFLSSLMADVTCGSVPPDDALTCLSIADKILDVARYSAEGRPPLSQAKLLTPPKRGAYDDSELDLSLRS